METSLNHDQYDFVLVPVARLYLRKTKAQTGVRV